jgi:hypothetical protein
LLTVDLGAEIGEVPLDLVVADDQVGRVPDATGRGGPVMAVTLPLGSDSLPAASTAVTA